MTFKYLKQTYLVEQGIDQKDQSMTDWEISKNRSYYTTTNSLRCTGLESKGLEGILFRVMLAAVTNKPYHLVVHKIEIYFSLTEPANVGKGSRLLPRGDSTIS